MSQRAKSHRSGTSMSRRRAAVVAAGLGVTAMLGTGAASAATGSSALPGSAAASVQAQATAQAKAASTAQQAAAKKAASWIDPVAHYTLSAGYAQGGSMWSTGKHSGQDFAVPIGTNVMAVHGGTVVKAGPNGAGDGPAYGNAVVIKHSDGTYSQYAHLSRIDVQVGQTVATGQHIALSGNTGNSSGPHLHFEIRTTPNYGSAVNPVSYLRSQGVTV
ncbi:M23 family metallopeptidase [Streptomyces sp. VRA16 Mangrove soil]|uniref:M23 family metallopeptidase n=1 Tax=Streptomyces sp. VRA16 Mangrove soil TaxID=2817434 RepID=UPI001A9E39A8|nr:M23 family metallopeptidase [Streptomyces sp. VRA16 Mangrove soil]MBO1333887.1 M23 family metallopeptidase [Streptomyces sp. VRA16 Mangrove soil]